MRRPMKNRLAGTLVLGVGLLALGAPVVHAQQSEQRARSRDLIALQDDLRLLDDSMAAVSRQHARYPEFQRRTDALRGDVTALADEIRRDREARRAGYDGSDARREGYGGGQAEVAALRQSIALLRDDLEEAQSQGRARSDRAYVIPVGTEIQVMLDRELSSRSSNVEDRVEASTVEAIRVDGRTVIPAGATVFGSVREVRSRQRGQSDDWLKLEFDSMAVNGGPQLPLRSRLVAVSEVKSGSDHTVRNTGLGAILGGVIGGIIDGKKGALIGAVVGAGGGLLASQGGKGAVELHEGALITLRLDAPMTVGQPVAYRR